MTRWGRFKRRAVMVATSPGGALVLVAVFVLAVSLTPLFCSACPH